MPDEGQQSQPTAPAPSVSPTSTPKKNSNKVMWIAVSAAAAVLVVILAVVIYLAAFSISKADYKAAQTKLNDIHATYDQLSDDLSDYETAVAAGGNSTAASDAADKKQDVADTLNKYKTQLDEFAKLKALRDKDVKAKYDEAKAQNEKFIAFVGSFNDSISDVAAAAEDCAASKAESLSSASASALLSAYDTALGPCMSTLDKLAKSGNQALKDYAAKTLDAYKKQRAIIEKMQNAYNDKDADAYYDAQSELSSQGSDFYDLDTKGINDAISDVSVSDQMEALDTVLSQKAR